MQVAFVRNVKLGGCWGWGWGVAVLGVSSITTELSRPTFVSGV